MNKTGILLTTSLVSSLIMLDSNIVAVSLPSIGRSLHASFTEIEWVISSYLLAYAVLLLPAGTFADLKGRKLTMLIGLIIFAVASAACGLAPSSAIMNTARGVQGAGGALLLTAALAIITHTFKGEERTHAFAIWGACLGIALTAGPILGGLITKYLGWRWIFLINPPVCILLIIATFAFVKESNDPTAKKMDWPGIVTFSPALFLLVWALIDGNNFGWGSVIILSRFLGSIIFAVAFVVVERRRSGAMVDFGLFKNHTFLGSVYAMIGYGATAQVMVFYLPLYLQNAYGFEPAKAGLSMLPFALPMVMAPRFASRLGSRYSGRTLLTIGLIVTILGNLLFWFIARSHLPYILFLISMLVAGTGAGILNGETVKVLQSAVPSERAGMASGLASTTRFIGILIGVAGMGAILSQMVKEKLTTTGSINGTALSAVLKKVTSGDTYGLPESIRAAGHAAYGSGFAVAALMAAGLAIVSAFLTYGYVRTDDTAPHKNKKVHCKPIDCRNPI